MRALAEQYARGLLPVTELLIDEEESGPTPPEEAPVKSEPEESDVPEDSEGESGREPSLGAVGGEYAKQLVRYLRKVAFIPGPAADLIYLESAGAMVGLEPEVADDLERAAVDGDQALVLDLVTPLDEPSRRAAVWLLASLVREAPVGVEGQNVLSTLLGTMSHTSLRLEQIAGDVANAVAGHQGKIELRPQDYSGALILGLASGGGVGSKLRDEVLGTTEALERGDVAVTTLRGTADIPAKFNDALGTACLTLLTGDSDDALPEALLALLDDEAVRVLTHARTPVNTALQRVDAAPSEDAGDGEETDGSEQTTETEESNLVETVARRLDVVQTRLGENDMMKAMASATTLALRSGQLPVEQTTFKHLKKLAPIQDRALSEALVDIAPGYVSSAWTEQIGLLDVTVLKTLSTIKERLGRLGALLWRRAMLPEDRRDSDERRAAGLAVLKKVVNDGAPIDRGSVSEAVGANLTGAFVDNANVDAQNRILAVGKEFVEASILDRSALADLV